MRKLILIALLTCSIAWMPPQISIAEVDPETAVGVWLFDEGAGNETKDASGNDHDGTINGAKWKDGKFGKALEFDGGQWVSIESTPELQVGEELTMMAWFFATDIGDWRQLIAKSDEYLLRIDPPQEGNRMSSFVKPGGSWEPRASANVPDEDTWIHFAATYDSNAKNEHLVVYVNGERAGVSTRPGDIAVTANAVEIGRWGGGSYFVGIIDEAAIFNTVLSEDDLKAIADNGLAKVLGGLAVAPTNKLATTWATLKADR
ncbi:LamG domain-containing protein [Candidatus Poribacteria bacterium]|nr:LamG domain-containing protein [Candidatus Poribacteria bacterium]MYA98474.1 LamG domain-containing protein [Candidatus Poribacteria bacterium]